MSLKTEATHRLAPVTQRLYDALVGQFGPDRIITDLTRLRTYECDAITGYRVVPALVALPESTEEVA